MSFTLPKGVKPVLNLVVQLALGALGLAGLLVVEVLLAGVIKVLEKIPFAPAWLPTASEYLEKGLFGFDVTLVILFFLAELAKFARGLWREFANG